MAKQSADEQPAMYELMYIINPVLNDEQTQDIAARVLKFITENGGDIREVVEMGSQRLAYPIQKKRNGFYVNVYFTHDDGDFVAKFDRVMRINDDIIRHMVLRFDAKMERYYQAKKAESAAQPEEAKTEAAEA